MLDEHIDKVIIVEGLTDKIQIDKIIIEPLKIICTNGTIGIERLDEIIDKNDLYDKSIYIFVDEDNSGLKLRKAFKRELSHAVHLHVSKKHREVAKTPLTMLARILSNNHIQINPLYLQ